MKTLRRITFVSVVSLTLASCTILSYTPRVSLDISPVTIQKRVLVEKFDDKTPSMSKTQPKSIINKNSMANDLDIEVTHAITSDFSTNMVFKEVSRKMENPDLIMRGEIKRFYGAPRSTHYASAGIFLYLLSIPVSIVTAEPRVAIFGTIPLLSLLLGVPTNAYDRHIEIKISFYDKQGNLRGSYTGVSVEKSVSTMYLSKYLAMPSMTNKAFSNAIQQIRDQIINDPLLLN